MCFDFLHKFFLNIHSKENFSSYSHNIYTDPHVKYPLFFSYFSKNLIFSTNLKKIFKYRFYKTPSSRSRVVPCGQTDVQTSM